MMGRTSFRWLLLVVALIRLGILLAKAPLTSISYWGIDIYTLRAAAKAMMMSADLYYDPDILRFADGATVGKVQI